MARKLCPEGTDQQSFITSKRNRADSSQVGRYKQHSDSSLTEGENNFRFVAWKGSGGVGT